MLQALTIQEALNIDTTYARPATIGQSTDGQFSNNVPPEVPPPVAQEPLPQAYQMAAPLKEAELMALLMASPMYQKLENIKKSVAEGTHKSPKHKMEEGNTLRLFLS